MQHSTDRILTTHVGSLPRPADLIAMHQGDTPADALAARLTSAVHDVVRKQIEIGIDVVNDGEFGKATRGPVDFGPWQSYAYRRLGGWTPADPEGAGVPSSPAGFKLGAITDRRGWQQFGEFYQEYLRSASFATAGPMPNFTAPIAYTGREAIAADIENLRAALAGVKVEGAFLTAVAPGSFARGRNLHYQSYEEFLFALAEALREEYRAILDAGYDLQLDDPGLPDTWDMMVPAPTLEEYRKYATVCVDAVNHALRDLPEDRIRYHICWGSWHGPHTTDIPLRDVVDLLLRVRASAYSIEAANVRHAHEWKVWRDVKLPDGKVLIPGVVSHATNVVEHPEVVADRILQFASVVGRENVIASTDCGLGGRVHPQIAWAKLETLVEGARLASKQLWGGAQS
jgi:5-methyltetrahydropteroyltriglutamate--homocysteine methyltransferase